MNVVILVLIFYRIKSVCSSRYPTEKNVAPITSTPETLHFKSD